MSFARSVLSLATGVSQLPGTAGNGGPLGELQQSLRQILWASPELAALIPQPLASPLGASPAAPLGAPPPAPLSASPPAATPAGSGGDAAEVASEARASSDGGLRRLRIRSGS
jgi:hypothetical protein